MVQLTTARVEIDGRWTELPASSYDKAAHKGLKCMCKDPQCPAELVHHKEYKQTFYSMRDGHDFQLKIAPHYQRRGGSPEHSPSCSEIKHYKAYRDYADAHGAVVQHGAFVFNLNIITDTQPAPERHQHGIPLMTSYSSAARAQPSSSEPRKLSEGINSTAQIARLIESSEFNLALRDQTIMRWHGRHYKLSDLFRDDTEWLFRERLHAARSGDIKKPAAVEFKPIAIGKYHSSKNLTIQGQAVHIQGTDGIPYYISMMLHCGSKKMYDDMIEMIRGKKGARSFMIFSDNVSVDRLEIAKRIREIRQDTLQDKAVFVHVYAMRPEQVHVWNRIPAEPVMDMHLPMMVAPPKEIPPELRL